MIDLKKAKVVYKEVDGAEEFARSLSCELGCAYSPINALCGGKETSLFIVIGGDGTLLKCARYASSFDVPVFGFNKGRLGFLAQADLREKEKVLSELACGNYRIEERLMLKTSGGGIALNDIVVKNIECSRTLKFKLYINNKLVCAYLADGLIVSSPTGSTAYNLSAGGAVIAPEIECITIVPICAHTLNVRAIVVSANDEVKIEFSAKNGQFQTILDGQLININKDIVTIKKYEKKAKLLLLNSENKNFYDILRDKLSWGVAPHA